MNRHAQAVNDRYEELMFAKTADQARQAARKLIRMVLGEAALNRPLEESLRACCRVMRPSADPREQQRFEAEFIELGIWPAASRSIAA